MQASELADRVGQVCLVHDVVAVEDGAGLVAGEQHSRLLGRARTDEVPDRRAVEVVRYPPDELRTDERAHPVALLVRGSIARRVPRRVVVADRQAVAPPEDTRDDLAEPPLECSGLLALALKQGLEGGIS